MEVANVQTQSVPVVQELVPQVPTVEDGETDVMIGLFPISLENFRAKKQVGLAKKRVVLDLFLKIYFPFSEGAYLKSLESGGKEELDETKWCPRNLFWTLYHSLVPRRFWLDASNAGKIIKEYLKLPKETKRSKRKMIEGVRCFEHLILPLSTFGDEHTPQMLEFCSVIEEDATLKFSFDLNLLKQRLESIPKVKSSLNRSEKQPPSTHKVHKPNNIERRNITNNNNNNNSSPPEWPLHSVALLDENNAVIKFILPEMDLKCLKRKREELMDNENCCYFEFDQERWTLEGCQKGEQFLQSSTWYYGQFKKEGSFPWKCQLSKHELQNGVLSIFIEKTSPKTLGPDAIVPAINFNELKQT